MDGFEKYKQICRDNWVRWIKNLQKTYLLGTATILGKILECNEETGGIRICTVGYKKNK